MSFTVIIDNDNGKTDKAMIFICFAKCYDFYVKMKFLKIYEV